MIKLIFTHLLAFGSLVLAYGQTELHDAKVTGNIRMGSMEVTAVQDLETECIYKTEMHTPGKYIRGESVQLEFTSGFEQGEVIKPNNPNKDLAHRNSCGGKGLNELTVEDVKTNLTAISVGMAELVQNQDFVNLVYSEVEKEAYGDYKVTLQALNIVSTPVLGKSLESALRESAKKRGYEIIPGFIHGFMDGNIMWHPDIYIPRYEEINKNNEIVTAAYFNDHSETINGYKINGTNQLEPTILDKGKVFTRKEVTGFIISITENGGTTGGTNNGGTTGGPVLPGGPVDGGSPVNICGDGKCSPAEYASGTCIDCPNFTTPPPPPPPPLYTVDDCNCETALGENHTNSPNDCLDNITLCNNGSLEAGETPCNCPAEFDQFDRDHLCYETISQFRMSRPNVFDSWGGRPEILMVGITETGLEVAEQEWNPKRQDIKDNKWYAINARLFHWNVLEHGRYYDIAFVDVDRFAFSNTKTEIELTQIPGTKINISSDLSFASSKTVLETMVWYSDPNPETYGSVDFEFTSECDL